MAEPKRVLIVDDSVTCRQYLRFILEKEPWVQVVGEAVDGEDAVRKALALKPDLITMDIHMPGMNGIEASRRILEQLNVPIVMVSDVWQSAEVQKAFEAMEIGAVGGVQKPPGPTHPDAQMFTQRLVRTVKLMAELPVIRRRTLAIPKKNVNVSGVGVFEECFRRWQPKSPIRLVAIGASTGGPPVLKEILKVLPADYPVPIVVVQHISPGFLHGMLEWLQRECAVLLRVGTHGERVVPGTVYFAPDGAHMAIDSSGVLRLTNERSEHGVKPSVSVLFRSVAVSYGSAAMAVLLTGMGKDGAQELRTLYQKGALTVVQDEASCVVFGMPGEALRLGAARCVLNPEAIGRLLLTCRDVSGL